MPRSKDVIRYDNYTEMKFIRKEIQNDKPIILGSTVLELNELHLFESFITHYNHYLKI